MLVVSCVRGAVSDVVDFIVQFCFCLGLNMFIIQFIQLMITGKRITDNNVRLANNGNKLLQLKQNPLQTDMQSNQQQAHKNSSPSMITTKVSHQLQTIHIDIQEKIEQLVQHPDQQEQSEKMRQQHEIMSSHSHQKPQRQVTNDKKGTKKQVLRKVEKNNKQIKGQVKISKMMMPTKSTKQIRNNIQTKPNPINKCSIHDNSSREKLSRQNNNRRDPPNKARDTTNRAKGIPIKGRQAVTKVEQAKKVAIDKQNCKGKVNRQIFSQKQLPRQAICQQQNEEQMQQERSRNELPHPIQITTLQLINGQEQFDVCKELSINQIIHYHNSSEQEEEQEQSEQQEQQEQNIANYSFEPIRFVTQKDSPSFSKPQQPEQLQINMQLFQKSAQQLLALDYLLI